MSGTVKPSLIILDIDGTILDTPHFEAWRDAGLEVAKEVGITSTVTDLNFETYATNVAGRPRTVGAEQVLRAMGVPSNDQNVENLAEVKQKVFRSISHRAVVFPDAARFLSSQAPRQPFLAVCTASENALDILADKGSALSADIPLNEMVDRFRQVKARVGNRNRQSLLTEIAKEYRSAPDQVVVIDDSIDAASIARHAGMKSVWLDRGASPEADSDKYDENITSLDDPIHILNGFSERKKGSYVAL